MSKKSGAVHKELIRELRKQVPDEKKHLQDMLDEIISEKTVKTDER